MTNNKDNLKNQTNQIQTSEYPDRDKTETSQKPDKKKTRLKFKEEDMYKIKYDFKF